MTEFIVLRVPMKSSKRNRGLDPFTAGALMSAVVASIPEINWWIKSLTVLSTAIVLGVILTRDVAEGVLECLLGALTSGTMVRLLQLFGR